VGEILAERYRILTWLGRGGMGEVYHAEDLRLRQPVALKFLPPALAADPARLKQFHNEVKIAREVSHPNVCRVYDIGDVDGHLFLSMEYVEGEDLAAALRRVGRFPEDQAIELTRQICAGLCAAHARGVLHRDLKPANIMLTKEGRARLMDFGLAAAGAVEHVLEGTPAYMAPEQLQGREVTLRSDIYALGLVMYELFTGARAFDASSIDELVAQRAMGAVRSPTAFVPTLHASVERAILQCLDPDPQKRPSSAVAVSAITQTLLLDATTTARRVLHFCLMAGGAVLLAQGLVFTVRLHGTGRWLASLVALVGVGLLLLVLRFPLQWEVRYKGHRIRFQNHPLFGERLYIDEALADRGRIGVHITLHGTIEAGDGAGERITAQSTAGFFTFGCRIVAESFG